MPRRSLTPTREAMLFTESRSSPEMILTSMLLS